MKVIGISEKTGTTLVEIVFAILILALIAAAALMMLRAPRFRVVADTHRQAAVMAANSAMEAALSMGYSNTNMLAGDYLLTKIPQRYSLRGITLKGRRKVEDIKMDGIDIKRVTVSVVYPGSETPVVLESYLSP